MKASTKIENTTGTKIKKWSENDNTIVLYNYKFGLTKLGVTNEDDFVVEFMGASPDSFKMQTLNVQFLLTGEGLGHFSRAQASTVKKYSKYPEEKLRKVVESIIDGTSEKEKDENKQFVCNNATARDKKRLIKKYFGDRKMTKLSDNVKESPYSKGDKIKHKSFGEGEVVDIIKNIMNIQFNDFTKKLVYNARFFEN